MRYLVGDGFAAHSSTSLLRSGGVWATRPVHNNTQLLGARWLKSSYRVLRPRAASSAADTNPNEQSSISGGSDDLSNPTMSVDSDLQQKTQRRKQQRYREQMAYQFAATAASIGVGALAVYAVYYRFHWHIHEGGEFPMLDMFCTVLLVFGGVVGMEFWARFAHKHLWHDFAPGWALHKSHHVPRVGPFEANDVYAIMNAVPAMALCLYGFLRPDVFGGVCFGAGLGITVFGIMYMFVHDGLVHKRFPVGPIANLPYLKRVAVAHKLHHSEKYNGVPFGIFFGPQELEAIGAKDELDKLVAELELSSRKQR